MLADHGAQLNEDSWNVRLTDGVIDKALATVPRCFRLYDVPGNETHDFQGDSVYFTPGSTALNILDSKSGQLRQPTTADYIQYVKLVSGLPYIAAQSTALIPADRGFHCRGVGNHEGPAIGRSRRQAGAPSQAPDRLLLLPHGTGQVE